MFEAIHQSTPKVQGEDISAAKVVPIRPPASAESQKALESSIAKGQTVPVERPSEDQQKKDETTQVTEKMLSELEQDIESIHNVGLQFSMHDDSGRTMVKIMDKTTEKVLREIPSEDVLDLVAKIEEMIGILFDSKA